ncbi:prepilin-type N-terminal cleavage/methylation domain-containing protein [Alcaligenaceae bacterium CGII-47]|nr:prepilin-type N-terminal cleavage/methylation domain-containing protein [Alcaligenaceae bacterium CGII-47]
MKTAYDRQRGFSLIEVSIVTAIVMLIAVIGIPTIGSYVVENKVPKVGEEITRFIVQMRVNANTTTATPYLGVSTANLANMMRDSSVLTVSVDGVVRHGLGSQGDIQVEAIDGGAGFSVTLARVSHAACPSIASVLQRVAEKITVGQTVSAGQVVKDNTVLYSALAVESACAKGDINRFTFTNY